MRAILLLLFLILGVSCLELAGIDVSTYQKNIDWKTVAKSKKFAIIRAGYGREASQQDRKFNQFFA